MTSDKEEPISLDMSVVDNLIWLPYNFGPLYYTRIKNIFPKKSAESIYSVAESTDNSEDNSVIVSQNYQQLLCVPDIELHLKLLFWREIVLCLSHYINTIIKHIFKT